MKFALSYFDGEEREGFYVQPLIKKAWAAQLEVLEKIDSICKRHGIQYFAEWGTLLGAVRHQGFVPWDDDMDIGMLREDYERFLYYARKELPDGYVVLDVNDDRFDEIMARVMNSDKIRFDEDFLREFHGCPYGIGVDIFCLDHIPKDKEEEKILLTLLRVADNYGKQWDLWEMTEEEREESIRELEEATGFSFNRELPMKGQFLQLADKLSAMYFDAESDEVTLMCLMIDAPEYRLPVSCYASTIEVPFENTTIPIPIGYEQVLRLRYGEDYMTPVKEWGTHDYPFFKSQIEQLRRYFQEQHMELPEYFDMECS